MVLDKTFIFYFNAIKVLGLGNSNTGVGRADICWVFFVLLKVEVVDLSLNALIIREFRLPENTSKRNFVAFFLLRIAIILNGLSPNFASNIR